MDRRAVEPEDTGSYGASLYVNYFEVAHNPYEFLVELGQYRPGRDDSPGSLTIHTRLALAPPYAKMLANLLTRAIAEHENGHGAIPALSEAASPFDIVLHSLPEFEERARRLRAHGSGQPNGGIAAREQGDVQTSKNPVKKGDRS